MRPSNTLTRLLANVIACAGYFKQLGHGSPGGTIVKHSFSKIRHIEFRRFYQLEIFLGNYFKSGLIDQYEGQSKITES